MLDDRDRALLDLVDRIGPVTLRVLARHPQIDGSVEDGTVPAAVASLADCGYLRRRTVLDVTGARIVEVDTPR